MADWLDRRQHYVDGGRTQAQTYEDLIGFRVLKAMGVPSPSKNIYKAEQRILGCQRPDLPVWTRVREMFIASLATTRQGAIYKRFSVDALEIKNVQDARERLELAVPGNVQPLLFVRVSGTVDCAAYTFWKYDELTIIKPPFVVLDYHDMSNELLLTRQDLTHFVSQFGPYNVLE